MLRDVLDRRLPGRAGDANHPRVELPPPLPGQRLKRRERIRRGEDPPEVVLARGRPGVLGKADDPPCPVAQGTGSELAAIRVLAGQPEEEVALGNGSRESMTACSGRPGGPVGQNLEAGRIGDSLGREVDHAARPAPRGLELCSRDLAVIERNLPAALELLALLVALAGDHDRVALAGDLERLADRGAAVHLDPHVVAGRSCRPRSRRRWPRALRSGGCPR